MKRLVADTSSIIAFFEGKNVPILNKAFEEGALYLPILVVSELLALPFFLNYRKELKQILKNLPISGTEFFHFANVGEICSRFKNRVTLRNAHIIQCALDMDKLLHTQDKDILRVSKKFNLKIIKN